VTAVSEVRQAEASLAGAWFQKVAPARRAARLNMLTAIASE